MTRREALHVFASCVVVFGTASAARAEAPLPPMNAAQFVYDLVNNALSTLRGHPPESVLENSFYQLLEQNFDVVGISAYLVGPAWRITGSSERDLFERVLGEYFVKRYTKQFNQLANERITVNPNFISLGNEDFEVPSVLSGPNHAPITIEWKVRANYATRTGVPTFLMEDIVVAGVSLRITEKAEFGSFISRITGGRGIQNRGDLAKVAHLILQYIS